MQAYLSIRASCGVRGIKPQEIKKCKSFINFFTKYLTWDLLPRIINTWEFIPHLRATKVNIMKIYQKHFDYTALLMIVTAFIYLAILVINA
jgi:hypothetical protein